MKRDMDLCRDILLNLEDKPFAPGTIKVEIDGKSEQDVSYHLKLLDQAGLVEAEDLSRSTQEMKWRANCLTWDGHEFLEASRNQGTWDRVKGTLAEKSVGTSFDIVKALLFVYGKQLLGLD